MRIKCATGIHTDSDLAEYFDCSQADIEVARQSGQIPAAWLVALVRVKQVNPEWILTGNAPCFLPRHREAGEYETGDEAAERDAQLAALRCLPSHLLAEELLRRIALAQNRAFCLGRED